ncbi:MAG TPA: glycosyltransferase [Bryobacteraceae bacterium]|jgi:glycosyltransferase involved in cell wall biosynthesis|nr:glycosyltransferase [Bryobacteraceae bacterium]
MSFYIDLTEFLTNPITTGIQRIEGEMCRYLPHGAAIPVRFHAGRFLALSPALIEAIGRYFRDPSESAVEQSAVKEIRRIGAIEKGTPVKVFQSDTVLVPEVIIEQKRLAFLNALTDEELQCYRFIIYDLLPITHPEYFTTDWLLEICTYYKTLRRAACCGFISEDTRDDYYRRLKRTGTRGGVVLPLGSDGLGPKSERSNSIRPLKFSVLGTIEPRKNHELILEAFEPLLRQVEGLTLSFIGKMGWVDPKFAHKVYALAADKNSGFQFHSAPDDGTIRQHIEQSRATIYISTAEGYGLPPVESLWVGTPVIASKMIPSLKSLAPKGIRFVEPLNLLNLRRVVLEFLDDTYAAQAVEETKSLNLPTWHSFTQEVLRWCGQDQVERTQIGAYR